ncbi:MAG: hypothetical protein JSS42_00500 [Proteobacteria bacterium]|nr:hypothetical protein [Pseudomonadota bacterium]
MHGVVPIALLDIRASDGSRQFAALPATKDWYAVRDHVTSLPGAELTGFICDNVTECWIDFSFLGEAFTINDQFGEYWFFVSKAESNPETLQIVANHWETLLGSA